MSKVAVVSGGTSGVGLSITRDLVKKNYEVHFIGTNKELGQELEKEFGASGNNSRFVELDLTDLKSVKRFAQDFVKQRQELHLLANVAGVLMPKRRVTTLGLEYTFSVGYLSAYVLVEELKPALIQAKGARVANVAGSANIVLKPRLDFGDFNFEKDYSGFKTTMATVHAKTAMSQYWAELLKDADVTVNSFHPGIVKGKLIRNLPAPLRLIASAGNLFFAKDSISGIYTCTSEKLNGISGQLIVGKKTTPIEFKSSYLQELKETTESQLSGLI